MSRKVEAPYGKPDLRSGMPFFIGIAAGLVLFFLLRRGLSSCWKKSPGRSLSGPSINGRLPEQVSVSLVPTPCSSRYGTPLGPMLSIRTWDVAFTPKAEKRFFAPAPPQMEAWCGWLGVAYRFGKGQDAAIWGMVRGGNPPSLAWRPNLLAWPNCGDRINYDVLGYSVCFTNSLGQDAAPRG
jgi:hypothetical protein